MSDFSVITREGYEITFYPSAYKKRPVITLLAPEAKRTIDFYLSGYVWRELQTKKRAPAAVEQQLKSLYKEFSNEQR